MIDKFCTFLVKKIKSKVKDIDEEKEMVIDYGIRLIFGELPKIILLFIIGFILGIGWYTLILFVLLSMYRTFTGGFHLKTHLGCMISTSILYLSPIALAKISNFQFEYIKYILIGITLIMSIVFIKKYAPADTENIPILSKKERKSKKIKAYIYVVALLMLSLFIKDNVFSYMLIYGIFLQNLTITPFAYTLTKCKHGFEVYTNESEIIS